ncbi:hypothetical protein [Mesorhizobium sp. M0058]|uniref:hypothetical protein n=1 Tax=Mesorhizobium sp. M0058 TaxID=2956865 RepID=UPI003336F7CC
MAAMSGRYFRQLLIEVGEIVRGAGGKCRLERGRSRGHRKLVIEIDGKRRETPVSGTPGCIENAINMKLADVRRILREVGR